MANNQNLILDGMFEEVPDADFTFGGYITIFAGKVIPGTKWHVLKGSIALIKLDVKNIVMPNPQGMDGIRATLPQKKGAVVHLCYPEPGDGIIEHEIVIQDAGNIEVTWYSAADLNTFSPETYPQRRYKVQLSSLSGVANGDVGQAVFMDTIGQGWQKRTQRFRIAIAGTYYLSFQGLSVNDIYGRDMSSCIATIEAHHNQNQSDAIVAAVSPQSRFYAARGAEFPALEFSVKDDKQASVGRGIEVDFTLGDAEGAHFAGKDPLHWRAATNGQGHVILGDGTLIAGATARTVTMTAAADGGKEQSFTLHIKGATAVVTLLGDAAITIPFNKTKTVTFAVNDKGTPVTSGPVSFEIRNLNPEDLDLSLDSDTAEINSSDGHVSATLTAGAEIGTAELHAIYDGVESKPPCTVKVIKAKYAVSLGDPQHAQFSSHNELELTQNTQASLPVIVKYIETEKVQPNIAVTAKIIDGQPATHTAMDDASAKQTDGTGKAMLLIDGGSATGTATLSIVVAEGDPSPLTVPLLIRDKATVGQQLGVSLSPPTITATPDQEVSQAITANVIDQHNGRGVPNVEVTFSVKDSSEDTLYILDNKITKFIAKGLAPTDASGNTTMRGHLHTGTTPGAFTLEASADHAKPATLTVQVNAAPK